ncbi:MAG: [FeFe] hydrogenase H-cluster maturation GTPase HydF, partial [Deltaproteobacteria bacterium]|nr:[FeFe] hydrogenase H-cluster maturation GTPase HydF [Deltaproteobacteria bacterium]
SQYKLIIHCGACMINRKEMLHRIMVAQHAGIPIVNYGVLIAYVMGILERALRPFPEVREVLEDGEK